MRRPRRYRLRLYVAAVRLLSQEQTTHNHAICWGNGASLGVRPASVASLGNRGHREALEASKSADDLPRAGGMSMSVTAARIDRAIHIVADMMVRHGLPLGPTIRFLEAARDKVLQGTTDMDYAKQILARNGSNKGSNITKPKAA
jgi:hypothetical protein